MYNRYRGNGSRPERMEDDTLPVGKRPQQERIIAPTTKKPPLPKLLPDKIGKSLASLETEDLLLILILYLMYRESGDKELLLIMGAMYLL